MYQLLLGIQQNCNLIYCNILQYCINFENIYKEVEKKEIKKHLNDRMADFIF